LLLVVQVDAVDRACHAADVHLPVLAHQVVLHLLRHSHHQLSLVVVHSGLGHARPLGLLLVVLVQLLNVQAPSALVDVHIPVDRALYLNRLCAVPLLRVQLAAVPTHVHRLDGHHVAVSMATCVIRSGNDRLASRIEAKVSLVHQLLVERTVHRSVVVLDRVRVDLVVSILEELVQDALLLIIVDVHALALDGAVELLLALSSFVVVSWTVARLHALAVLGSIWQGQ